MGFHRLLQSFGEDHVEFVDRVARVLRNEADVHPGPWSADTYQLPLIALTVPLPHALLVHAGAWHTLAFRSPLGAADKSIRLVPHLVNALLPNPLEDAVQGGQVTEDKLNPQIFMALAQFLRSGRSEGDDASLERWVMFLETMAQHMITNSNKEAGRGIGFGRRQCWCAPS